MSSPLRNTVPIEAAAPVSGISTPKVYVPPPLLPAGDAPPGAAGCDAVAQPLRSSKTNKLIVRRRLLAMAMSLPPLHPPDRRAKLARRSQLNAAPERCQTAAPSLASG